MPLFWLAVWPQGRTWLARCQWVTEKGALAFRPDSLAAVSLSRDQLLPGQIAPGIPTLSLESVLTADPDTKKKRSLMKTPVCHSGAELIHIKFNIGCSARPAYKSIQEELSLERTLQYLLNAEIKFWSLRQEKDFFTFLNISINLHVLHQVCMVPWCAILQVILYYYHH